MLMQLKQNTGALQNMDCETLLLQSSQCSWGLDERAVGQVLMNREDFMVKSAFLSFIPQRNKLLSMLVGICIFYCQLSARKRWSLLLCACPCVLVETKGYELLRYVTGAEFCSASESVPGLSGFLPG